MDTIYIGDIISSLFILFILGIMIVMIVRFFKKRFKKNNEVSTQNNSPFVQQVHELTMRINRLEKQVEELQKKSL